MTGIFESGGGGYYGGGGISNGGGGGGSSYIGGVTGGVTNEGIQTGNGKVIISYYVNQVSSILATADGTLWIGTSDGLSRYLSQRKVLGCAGSCAG